MSKARIYVDWITTEGGKLIYNHEVTEEVMNAFRADVAAGTVMIPTADGGRALEEGDIPHVLAITLITTPGLTIPEGHMDSIVLEEAGRPILLIERADIVDWHHQRQREREGQWRGIPPIEIIEKEEN